MNLMQCKRGHYYDGDKYADCPHCAKKDMQMPDTVRMSENIDAEETEQRREPKEHKKALKDAVLEALEKKRESEVKKESAGSHLEGKSLPTGVLVCVGTNEKGRLYPLRMGKNYIGYQNDKVAVCGMKADLSVCYMELSYHEDANLFILTPEGVGHTVQVGRIALKESLMLKPYDKIVMKDAMLLFVPICGTHFTWSN